ncbi:flagellar hook-associated protein 3 [Pseudoalteromonas shioyasakiensis]|uniref:flagellar hook-associated protein FlgL n=1 Tax=Pseudoalteromonas shioyasakiensis TaxID=1190813 RepID=UPI0020958F73|nr:flagellar hook-associated protein FlgL [Pseudoalteromonas shioyasakiensis]MCO6354908.1 flagellar hook-associated protein 3 [Pseudoalteromonas shioyasakiensis]
MRISNNMMYKNNLNSILNSQQNVNKAQEQVSTQKRVLTSSDDPSAMARAQLLTDRIQVTEQFNKNVDFLVGRLTTEESVLDNITNAIQRANTLTIQAGNGALNELDRKGIAAEIGEIQKELFELMNSKSEDGKYIFSGYQDGTQTYIFDSTSNRYEYQGDQGKHEMEIASGVLVKASDNAFDTFETVDKRLNVNSNLGNVSGGIVSASVYVDNQTSFNKFHTNYYNADPTAPLNANTITIDIISGTPDQYQVLQAGTPITPPVTGTFTGEAIKFDGIEIEVQGTAPGQVEFELEKPGKENILNTLQDLRAALVDRNISDADFGEVISSSIVQIENASNKVSLVQAGLGARLNVSEKVEQNNQSTEITDKSFRASLVEIDLTEAITELSKQETSLQASQATFGRLANLSLFDYIR